MKNYFYEKCGVYGLYGVDVYKKIVTGLYNLQHRGHDSCGVACFIKNSTRAVHRTFSNNVEKIISDSPCLNQTFSHGIGHTRYNTSLCGNSKHLSLHQINQPFSALINSQKVFFAHNGNIHNIKDIFIQNKLEMKIENMSDSRVLFYLFSKIYAQNNSIKSTLRILLNQIKGGFAILIANKNCLWGIRDHYGIRPLFIAKKNNSVAFASEAGALRNTSFSHIEEIPPGSAFYIQNGQIDLFHYSSIKKEKSAICALECVYFSRNDSIVNKNSLYEIRKNIGCFIAQNYKNTNKIDSICPVPDGGLSIGLGFAQQKNIPLEFGIQKIPTAKRSFIQSTQKKRQEVLKRKFFINPTVFDGKNVIIIDDSLVRGNTLKEVIKLIRTHTKPKQIHCIIASPPILYPDYYGIDIPDKNHLIACKMSTKEMCSYFLINSIFFLSIENLHRAIFQEERDKGDLNMSDHVFTNFYPDNHE